MKLKDVIEAYEGVVSIINTNEINFCLAWQLSDLKDALEVPYNRFVKERDLLVKKYGVEVSVGSVKVMPEKYELFSSELQKLIDLEINFEYTSKIKLVDLIDAKLTLSKGFNLISIKPFIEVKKIDSK